MRSDRTDEIINNILSVRIEIAKLDLKIEQMFRAIENMKNEEVREKLEEVKENDK